MTKLFVSGNLILIDFYPRGSTNSELSVVLIICLKNICNQVSEYGYREYYEEYVALHHTRGLVNVDFLSTNKVKNCGLRIKEKNGLYRFGHFIRKIDQ